VTASAQSFERQVIDLAQMLGWTVAHFRPAKTVHGWRTPVSGDGKGFPDLVLVGHDQVLYRELKSGSGRLSDDQKAWRDVLTRNGADWAEWRPEMWPQIAAELGAKVAA
jgi:hypothetical protein